jgi:ubiquinone/menaquinone biosynthesis C-methylase UbiE
MDVRHARALIPLLRIFFRLLYNQFAWTYDLVSWSVSIGMWNDWIKSILSDITGQQILELGHGPGHLQLALLQKGKQVTGIDLSPYMGRICSKRIRKAQKRPYLVNGTALHLPFPKNSFDQIVSTFPTPYIIEDHTITEMYRVLRPGGSFIILPVAWITGGNILHKTAAWLFKFTGQAPNIDKNIYLEELKHFNLVGFITNLEMRELSNSQVMLIRGVKTVE